ncbi:hypothetical protein BJY52DRAFT_238947 [Lactarius psammicola]|nr:hypothetical protein BJY52DRAFT_238947 [Lactarius psammicola]
MAEGPSILSASTLHNSQTVRSKETNTSSRSRVVTRPPWAKDEPPSPTDSHHALPSPGGSRGLSEARRSDVASPDDSSAGPSGGAEHRWFPFARRRPHLASEVSSGSSSTTPIEKKPPTLRTSLSGLPDGDARPPVLGERSPEQSRSRGRDWGLRITMPTPPVTPHTLAHSRTPGWDSPWVARPPESLSRRNIYEQLQNGGSVDGQPPDSPIANESWWPRARKRARAYLLTNTYVPLLFRFVNITFTTAALAIAIRIRRDEARNDVTGVLGSSPTLVVIFAPLTLVHVMVAIYLEYFGRPLGLWRTSAKLAHTLLEVLFICAWSAALSLCFDNFFTSPIPCASPSEISWYSNIPRSPSPFGDGKGSAGEALCDNQVALVCLVGIGLLMYCFNLVISLYRIFEKVKYHHPSVWGDSSTRV